MSVYLVLYILIGLVGITVLSDKNSSAKKRFFLWVSFLLMSLVIGLRSNSVGEDTDHYLLVFRCSNDISWLDLFRNGIRTPYHTDQYGYTDTIESGYIALCKIINWFTSNEQMYLIIIAGITCLLFAKFIYDNSKDVLFSTYVFLCESIFMYSFNGMRQALAMAIGIHMYTFLKEKKLLKAVAIVIAAMLIHNSAVILFVLFPIMMIKSRNEKRYFKYLAVLALSIPLFILLLRNIIGIIFPRYASYFLYNYWENSLGGVAVLWILEIVLILAMYILKFSRQESFVLSICVLLYLGLEIAAFQISALGRLALYFRAFLVLFFPNAMQYFSKRTGRWAKLIALSLITLLFLSYARADTRIYTFFLQA